MNRVINPRTIEEPDTLALNWFAVPSRQTTRFLLEERCEQSSPSFKFARS